jgi:hypothetical protein
MTSRKYVVSFVDQNLHDPVIKKNIYMQKLITLLCNNITDVMFVHLMVFNATFNNISVISWQSVLLVEETGGPRENQTCCKSLTKVIT